MTDPVPAGSGRMTPGQALRTLTGVDEATLATVSSERARYTAMGGVVLGTATMAMLSMGVALFCIFGEFNPVILAVVPIWGLFILFLDRWLMSSTVGRRPGARFLKLLPRFLLAIVFGVIIAEPLLLGIFHTAIEERIRDDRAIEIRSRESDLRLCNPVPGTPEAASGVANEPRCAKLRLGATTDSEAKQKEADALQAQLNALKADVAKDAEVYAGLEQKAREECNGTPGPGLTGRIGEGPNCKRLRAEADQYRSDHRIDENNQKIAQLTSDLAEVTTATAASRSDVAGRIDEGIRAEVNKFRDNQRKQIGLLERLGALGDLVSDSGYVLASEWALRLFFVVVDSLPVLLKFLSGYTTYDQIVADRLRKQERAQRVANETARRDAILREELARHQMTAEHAAARNRIEFDARIRHVDVEVMREDLTDSRAAYLLAETPTISLSAVGNDPDDRSRRLG